MFTLGNYALSILLLQLLISFNEFNGISCEHMSEGQTCTNDGKSGVCLSLEKCPLLEKNIKSKKLLPINYYCGFKENNVAIYCCTDIPVDLEVKASNFSQPLPKPGSNVIIYPLNNTSITTEKSLFSENDDKSENGNAIDIELTTINSIWQTIKNPSTTIQSISSTESRNSNDSVINNVFNNRIKSELLAVTDYPIKNSATSTSTTTTTTTTQQPLVLDPWMIEAIEEAKKAAALISKTTTTTTPTPITIKTTKSSVGYIDLSRKQTKTTTAATTTATTTTTTTTVAPLVIPSNEFQNKPNNIQTVWVIEDPSRGPGTNNNQQVNWNRGRPNQNFNGPINQQHSNNWNRHQQQQQQQQQHHQQQQNWNRPSDQIQVIVIEEEEQNGRDARFQNNRPNWNRSGGGLPSNSQAPGINGNFNQQQQFRPHHHTWNGNGFNHGHPNPQNHNVEFVQAFNTNVNQQNRHINGNIGAIQTSNTVSALNPDNPFLKTVLNPNVNPAQQQRSAKLIQFQPAWNNNNNNNNNNNPSFGFQRF